MNLLKRTPDSFDTDLMDLPARFLDNSIFRDRVFPMVNIRNLDKEFRIEMAVPGYKKEDLHVEVAEGLLTVSSEQCEERESDQDGWERREFRYNSFSRSFDLPDRADADGVVADFKDGVLNLIIAKKAEAKLERAKAITIK